MALRTLIILSLLFISRNSFGQFAVITDPDGHCNVRTSAGTGRNIMDSQENGHFIYVFEMQGNWANIDYRNKEKDLNGYIYKDRFKLVSDFRSIPLIRSNDTLAVFSNDSIKVMVGTEAFRPSKHKYSFYKEDPKVIMQIDHKKYWGTDGEMPKTQYKYIRIIRSGKTYQFPAVALASLFEVNTTLISINEDPENDILYIQSFNSDGAGSYYVIWKFEKGKYAGRFLAYGF